MTKQLAIYGTAVMTTLLALLILWQFRIVAIYVLISLTLAAAIRPLVQRLVGRAIIIRIVWILLYILVLSSFVFILFLTGKAIVSEIQFISQNASVRDAWLVPSWLQGTTFQKTIFARIPSPSKLFDAVTGAQGQLVLPAMLGFFQGIGGVLSGVFVILFLSIYWSVNQVHFETTMAFTFAIRSTQTGKRCLAYRGTGHRCLHTQRDYPKSTGRVVIWTRVMATRITVSCIACVGWSFSLPYSRGWRSVGYHHRDIGGSDDQCSTKPVYCTLCFSGFDLDADMGQTPPI